MQVKGEVAPILAVFDARYFATMFDAR